MINKIFRSLTILGIGFFIVIGVSGCKGPTGPAGKDVSVNALEGYADGIQCAKCHNADSDTTYRVAAMKLEYENSHHGDGIEFSQNGNTCAGCHTNEGFYERYLRGFATETFSLTSPSGPMCMQNYPESTRPGCFTCHSPHIRGNFSMRDSAATNIFTLVAQQPTTVWNSTPESNLCVKCHQPRMTSTFLIPGSTPTSWQPDPTKTAATDTAKIYTSRWNNHVSGEPTQILLGTGGVELTGANYLPYSDSYHTTLINNKTLGCPDCHMATPTGGNRNGGHTFAVRDTNRYTSSSYNLNGCSMTGCHVGITTSETHWVKRNEIIGLTAQLAKMLMDTSVTNKYTKGSKKPWVTVGTVGAVAGDTVYGANASSSSPLVISPADKAGALWNLQMAVYEKSHGMHNYAYIKALLSNSITELTIP